MYYGVDRLIHSDSEIISGPVGLVTNDAALITEGVPVRAALMDAGMKIEKLFSPEHGLSVRGADGLRQYDHVDLLTGLPVISLYSEKLAPTYEDLKGLNAVYFDIPDIGCRFYTYLWTMTHVMEACAKAGIPMVILDRPNPTGMDLRLAEGPLLNEERCSSFIGRWNIPLRHCCTLGELARYFAATRIPALSLKVVKAPNCSRRIEASSAPSFVPTSPAIQRIESALCYPGTGLAEGLNLNEGRGTEYSFVVYAAPWLDPEKIIDLTDQEVFPGIRFIPCTYTAVFPPYLGETCRGILWEVTDPDFFQPVRTGWELLKLINRIYPSKLEQRLYPTAANPTGKGHLDRLTGVPDSFSCLLSGSDPEIGIAEWWKRQIESSLLYC